MRFRLIGLYLAQSANPNTPQFRAFRQKVVLTDQGPRLRSRVAILIGNLGRVCLY